MLPLLHHIATSTATGIGETQLAEATAIQLDVMGTMVGFEHTLLEIAMLLERHRYAFAVLKGAATAHLDYVDPSLRQFGDIDLLVSPHDFAAVSALLDDQGWRRPYTLPRHHAQFTHAITWRRPGRVEVDVHQRIAHRAVGQLVPTSELLTDAAMYRIAGFELPALSRTDRLIHAALHAMSRGPYRRLSSTADVLVLVEASATSAAAVLAHADVWKVRSLVEHAISSSYEAAQLSIPGDWRVAMRQPYTGRDRLVDHAYLSPRRRAATEELAYLRLLSGWRNRALYLRGYFATGPDYAARRRRSGPIAQGRYLWSRIRSDGGRLTR